MAIPLVSVCMITYNHEKFIAQAIKGVLMQQTDFDVEFIISNDASTDGSDDIIKELIKDSQRIKIRYFSHSENKGMMPNFIWSLSQCDGKYIALCEGDDYWTDPLKLQKQVDFLEQNEEYVMSYHNAKIVDENNKLIEESKLPLSCQIDFEASDLKAGAFVLTLSLVFRNIIKAFPPEIYKVVNGDTFLISILGQFGKGKYLSSIEDAGYRAHSKGVWSSMRKELKTETSLGTALQLKAYYKRLNDVEFVLNFDKRIKNLRRGIILSDDKNARNRILLSLAKELRMAPIVWYALYKLSLSIFKRGYYFEMKLRRSI